MKILTVVVFALLMVGCSGGSNNAQPVDKQELSWDNKTWDETVWK